MVKMYIRKVNLETLKKDYRNVILGGALVSIAGIFGWICCVIAFIRDPESLLVGEVVEVILFGVLTYGFLSMFSILYKIIGNLQYMVDGDGLNEKVEM